MDVKIVYGECVITYYEHLFQFVDPLFSKMNSPSLL